MNPTVSIIMGSTSDLPVMKKAADFLNSMQVPFEMIALSAHRTPDEVADFAHNAEARGVKVIIAGAGMAAALPGVIAAITPLPVIGVPLGATLMGQDALLSIAQMPPGIPVATTGIDGAMNAAVLAVRIPALADTEIKLRYDAWRASLGEKIVKANESLRDVAYEFKNQLSGDMGYKPYSRRKTTVTHVGKVKVGSDFPIRLQSMNNTSTTDVEVSAAQALRIAAAGADINRLTAQGVREAHAMGEIRRLLRERGCDMPLVADIHFNPKAAFAAAAEVEKVRINPGNFVDPGRVFKKIEFTDLEYEREIGKIAETFVPFLQLCREHGTAIRIGVNHGSLSDRIMSRYGDTPEGMVESAMEFLRVAVKEKFFDIVISIKASNVVVMTRTVRMLVEAMDREDMHFPLHPGVTEAGDGEDARVKSALGIGSLLADGIGDTIRVSLSEGPEAEIPVGRMIVAHIDAIAADPGVPGDCDGPLPARVVDVPLIADVDPLPAGVRQLRVEGTGNVPGKIRSALRDAFGCGVPVMVHVEYPAAMTADEVRVAASVDLGSVLLDGLVDVVSVGSPHLSGDERRDLLLGILQAARLRFTKTEFIACPGCGRTMFDLRQTLARVKEALQGYPGLKIGVMGCIVNGPGEMADADYGYVGAGVGRVSLYRGKECVLKNIPSEEAVEHLLALLRADGRIE